MAKKKKEPIDEIKVKETAVESVESKIASEVAFEEEFVSKQLMAINKLPNRARAKRLAERVLRNRKG